MRLTGGRLQGQEKDGCRLMHMAATWLHTYGKHKAYKTRNLNKALLVTLSHTLSVLLKIFMP